MCLAIPAKIETINDNNIATVDMLGVKRDVALDLTPGAKLGDYVLVHAGYAIEVISMENAEETISLLREFPELAGEPQSV